ncbi:HNH endonuclease family protein [Acidipropionibacterium timonense]|uniref:HNH endonuclease family protein n=1 Tax=Acidipropionibacterium timonense TaxID=2161818 RepID=UPI0010301006|nr:HNH endonuclease family protein [Acidipropionibacterium timonense]
MTLMRRRGVTVAGIAVVIGLGWAGGLLSRHDAVPSTTVNTVTLPAATSSQPHQHAMAAIAALADLPVKGRAAKTGYSRAQFGPTWTDDTTPALTAPWGHDGCDTRNDALARDLTNVHYRAGSRCVVIAGTLADPYTGHTIAWVKGPGTSDAVQIDHVVALADASQTGAQHLDTATRTALANDPLNLLAVDGPTNQAKSDGDAATWLPPRHDYRCPYIARQIAVKTKYHLWITPAEKTAMTRVLTTCPTQPLPR